MLEEEGEEGMMHSLLTSLPDLYEEGEEPVSSEPEPATLLEALPSDIKAEETEPCIPAGEDVVTADTPPTPNLGTSDLNEGSTDVVEGAPSSSSPDDLALDPPATVSLIDAAAVDEVAPSAEPKAEDGDPLSSKEKPDPSSSESSLSEKEPLRRSPSPEPRPHRPRVSLTALLARADALYSQYPPTHPGVAVSSVLGPQSVMLTWSERRAELPSDDDAERMVLNPDLIVLPHIESNDDVASDGDSYRAGSGRKSQKSEREKRRRKLRKPRRLTDMVVQRKTMVAGAVLVLGVAMAVYGFNSGLPGSGGGHHRSGFGREFKKVGRFLGGAIVGLGERAFEGIHQVLQ